MNFEKALPRYQAVIQSNIEPITTESALLDLASHYLHIGQVTTSDSLIALITKQFPEGIYVQKKKAKENLDRIDKNSAEAYKDCLFFSANWRLGSIWYSNGRSTKAIQGHKMEHPLSVFKS